ncbi:MAG TPA: histidinol-phosphate transaminase [Cytophagales bacterium]|jgi:histidinol-phosphate aminotransferase|nr:histidinol-phosphate transaminase [Cytophagales bacterium]
MDIRKLIRPNVQKLKPYSSARDEFEGEATVFLDANENPYASNYNRYPDPHQKKLKERISQIKNIEANKIFLGNGSDEAIDLLYRAFCEPGIDEVLIPEPTYGMYSVSANINNIKINSVKLTSDFDIDVESIHKSITPSTKLIFFCSPNNPSSNLLTASRIIQVLESFQGLVIVDEAYIDFTSTESFTTKLNGYANLVVLQTLSKAWGLASLRLGMCFASKEIISVLNKIKPPYNISGAIQEIVLNQLSDTTAFNAHLTEVLKQRKLLSEKLKEVSVVQHLFPSDANFILVRVKNAREIYNQLLSKGIVVRDRSSVVLCNDCLRITVGTPEENEILITELKNL